MSHCNPNTVCGPFSPFKGGLGFKDPHSRSSDAPVVRQLEVGEVFHGKGVPVTGLALRKLDEVTVTGRKLEVDTYIHIYTYIYTYNMVRLFNYMDA